MSRGENAGRGRARQRPGRATPPGDALRAPGAAPAALAADPAVRKSFIIYFTARSGSTWLKELLEGTGRLGKPGELFAPRRAERFEGKPLAEQVAFVRSRNVRGGVFGAELTWGQITRTFGDAATFLSFFRDAAPVFLIREDVVMQAISVVRKRQTRVGHIRGDGGETLKTIDGMGEYNGDDILRAASGFVRAEKNFDEMFAAHDLSPLRLSYERVVSNPLGAVNAICRHLGEPEVEALPPSEQQTLRTDKSYAYAERFRAEHREFVETAERERAARLAKLATF